MDFLLLGLGLAALVYLILIHRQLRQIDVRLTIFLNRLNSRQASVRGIQKTSHASPPIDARARTTRRDTDDLPRTGRMGKLQPREVGDTGGHPDDR